MKTGRYQIECHELADMIAERKFERVYISLYVRNPAYAPIVVDVFNVADDLASALVYASEGDRYMDVEVIGPSWGDGAPIGYDLYIECGQHAPEQFDPPPMYTRLCPVCSQTKMSLHDFRQGNGDEELARYQCDNCLADVTIKVEPYDEEGDEDE